MPGLTTAIIVSGIVGAAGSVASAKMNSNAAKRATSAQSKATSEAQQMERDAEAENRRQFDLTQQQNEQRWNSEQDRDQMRYDQGRTDTLRREAQDNARWAYDNRRRATTRAAGRAAVEDLAKAAGLTLRETEQPPDMAQGWDNGALTPPQTSETYNRPPLSSSWPSDPKYGGVPVNRKLSDLGAA